MSRAGEQVQGFLSVSGSLSALEIAPSSQGLPQLHPVDLAGRGEREAIIPHVTMGGCIPGGT